MGYTIKPLDVVKTETGNISIAIVCNTDDCFIFTPLNREEGWYKTSGLFLAKKIEYTELLKNKYEFIELCKKLHYDNKRENRFNVPLSDGLLLSAIEIIFDNNFAGTKQFLFEEFVRYNRYRLYE